MWRTTWSVGTWPRATARWRSSTTPGGGPRRAVGGRAGGRRVGPARGATWGPGRVGLPDGREAVAALLGAMRIGAVAVPLDRVVRGRDGGGRARVRAARRRGPPRHAGRGTLRPVPPVRVPAGARRPRADRLHLRLDGAAEGVVHTRAGLEPAGPNWLRDGLGVGPGDRVLAGGADGDGARVLHRAAAAARAGAAAVLTARRPSPRATLDLVARAGVTVLAAAPMHWGRRSRPRCGLAGTGRQPRGLAGGGFAGGPAARGPAGRARAPRRSPHRRARRLRTRRRLPVGRPRRRPRPGLARGGRAARRWR